jgi:hypothetical protein
MNILVGTILSLILVGSGVAGLPAAASIRVPDGFKIELVKEATSAEGSWVCLCVDPTSPIKASHLPGPAPVSDRYGCRGGPGPWWEHALACGQDHFHNHEEHRQHYQQWPDFILQSIRLYLQRSCEDLQLRIRQ